MQKQIEQLTEAFKGKVNLLVVDDYPVMGNAVVDLFASPVFSTSFASSAKEARQVIAATAAWHCWICDIAMEEEQSGLQLLAQNPKFPFIIMLSGIRSMNLASRAMQLGAFKVFDKDPLLLPALHEDVCTLAAIAWILQGAGTKYLSLFLLLSDSSIDSTETWANKACLTVRQLERICSLHSHLTPRFIPPLFNTLKFLLQLDGTTDVPRSAVDAFDPGFPILQHVDFVVKHLDIILAS